MIFPPILDWRLTLLLHRLGVGVKGKHHG